MLTPDRRAIGLWPRRHRLRPDRHPVRASHASTFGVNGSSVSPMQNQRLAGASDRLRAHRRARRALMPDSTAPCWHRGGRRSRARSRGAARNSSIALRVSPRSFQALPRLPSALPSPRRSPISRAIARLLLVELDRLARLAEIGPGDAQIAQRVALATPVADLTRDREALLVELDRLARLAEIRPGDAQIAERAALAAPIADLTRDREALLVEARSPCARSPSDPAQRAVAQIAERVALAAPLAESPRAGGHGVAEPSRSRSRHRQPDRQGRRHRRSV